MDKIYGVGGGGEHLLFGIHYRCSYCKERSREWNLWEWVNKNVHCIVTSGAL